MYHKTSAALLQVLQKRIDQKTNQKYRILLSCSIALLGTVVIFILLLRSLSKNRKAENALRNARDNLENEVIRRTKELADSTGRLQAILDTAVDGIITIDENGIIESFNPAAEKIFGYAMEEVLGENVSILVPEPHHSKHDEYLRNYKDTGQGRIIGIGREVEAKRKDGSLFPMELGVNKIDIAGQHGFVGVTRDISERKQAEDKLQRYARQLELQTLELEHAKEKADEANKMKGEFLANMSHEIRTPMNGIIGMTELLLETGLTPKQKNYASTVINSADSLLEIINDILDFSKIESGKLELEPIPFDLMTVVEDAAELLTIRAHEKAIELIVRYVPGTPQHLVGDPGRIRQIINNLAGNAIKFTQKGYVMITVEEDTGIATTHKRQKRIKISVTDTGIGIPEDAQKKIFDKFSQADTSTTRKFGGTGLGLAICQKLTSMMEGEIQVESTLGEGSTFWFSMQLDADEEADKTPDTIDNLKGLHVLIVDDIPVNGELIAEYLRILEAEPVSCHSADKALELLETATKENQPFQIAILDYLMPEVDGEHLARKIHDSPDIIDPVMVMLSSAGSTAYSQRFMDAGIDAYLSKPIKVNDFNALLSYTWKKACTGESNKIITSDDLSRSKSDRLKYRAFSFDNPSVLLAEDNRVNQGLATELLEQSGCSVYTVINGKQAIEAVRDESFDLILMDCEMPEMDGFEASSILAEWKNDNTIGNIPIVALTGNAMKGDRDRCLDAGMQDYVTKPIRKNQLLRVMAKWLPDHVIEASSASHRFDGYHVLLVEDNLVNQAMAEQVLTNIGFTVSIAENGKVALKKITEEPFDLVLMDCQMPEMDGFEATREIRKLQQEKTVNDMPVIALTANVMKGDKEKCLSAGMNDYIGKPVKKITLQETIAKWLLPVSDQPEDNPEDFSDLIDSTIFNNYRNVMGDDFTDSIRLFLGESKKKIDNIQQVYKDNNMEELAAISHFLKTPAALSV